MDIRRFALNVVFLAGIVCCTLWSVGVSTWYEGVEGHGVFHYAIVGLFYFTVTGLAGLAGQALGQRVGALMAILSASIFFLLFFLDYKLFRLMGLHLFSPFVFSSMASSGFINSAMVPVQTLVSCLIVLTAVFLSFCLLLRFRHRFRCLGSLSPGLLFTVGVLPIAVVHAFFLARPGFKKSAAYYPMTGPLYGYYANQRPIELVINRPHPALATVRRDILVIAIESLRADALDPKKMPLLSQFISQNQCLTSRAHYSGGHETVLGTFALLSGISPHLFPVFAETKRALPSFSYLRELGYQLQGVSATVLKGWRGAGIIVDSFDRYRELTEHRGEDTYRNDMAVQQFVSGLKWDSGRPRFLMTFLNATHWNYTFPLEDPLHTSYAPFDFNALTEDLDSPPFRQSVRRRYENAVHFVDRVIADIITEFPAALVVIAGDHGEEFWEQGVWGHGAALFNKTRIQTLFTICGVQRGADRLVASSSHIDIFPTIFHELGVSKEHRAEIFSGIALQNDVRPDRLVPVVGSGFPYSSPKIAFVGRHKKLEMKKVGSGITDLELQQVRAPDDQPTAEQLSADDVKQINEMLTSFTRDPLLD